MAGSGTTIGTIQLTAEEARFWSFFVHCAVITSVFILVVFYLNRIVARFLSYLLRLYLWRKHQAYVHFDSIKISILGGKILFRNARYHSRNQSITVVRGHISFRYWLRHVQENTHLSSSGNLDQKSAAARPCRFYIYLDGLEYFAYNRTPAYDYLESLWKQNLDVDETAATVESPDNRETSLFERVLPVSLEFGRGSTVVGSPELESIMIIDWKSASGIYRITKSRSPLDLYKTTLHLTFQMPKVQFRSNTDLKNRKVMPNAPPKRNQKSWWSYLLRLLRCCKEPVDNLNLDDLSAKNRPVPQWNGLSRYQIENMPAIKRALLHEEYAKVTTIVQAGTMEMSYYTDVAGPVKTMVPRMNSDIRNPKPLGELSPQWGLDLKYTNTTIQYGPWADRQRTQLQAYFFPYVYRTYPITKLPKAGQARMHESLNIHIEFTGDTTWRLPTREPSKDWKYAPSERNASPMPSPGNPQASSGRTYGWLDLKMAPGATVNWIIPMLFTDTGYTTKVEIKMPQLKINSSLNYATFLTASKVKIAFDMKCPLEWKDIYHWFIDIQMSNAKIYLLRDHSTLVQDLMADWTARPAPDFNHFLPYHYRIHWNIDDAQIFLCANEQNIIDQPNELDQNVFFVLTTPRMSVNSILPYTKFEPLITRLPFDIELLKVGISLSLPPSNTIGAFGSPEIREVGHIDRMRFDGIYEYCSILEGFHTEDSVRLDIQMTRITLKLTGYFLRYFGIFQNNYAGADVNFQTLDEYREKLQPSSSDQLAAHLAANEQSYPPFEFYYTLGMEDVNLICPENLYDCDRSSKMFFHELLMDGRITNELGEFQMNISPMTWVPDKSNTTTDDGFLRIDEIDYFTHRLYGIPPGFLIYASNSRVNIGKISGEMQLDFLTAMLRWYQCLAFNLADTDNALNDVSATAYNPDLTFFQLKVATMDLAISGLKDTVLHVKAPPGIEMKSDSWATALFSAKTVIEVPEYLVQVLHAVPDGTEISWIEAGRARGPLRLSIVNRGDDQDNVQQDQMEFLRRNDILTQRCHHLYKPFFESKGEVVADRDARFEGTFERFIPLFSVPGLYNVPASDVRVHSYPDDDTDESDIYKSSISLGEVEFVPSEIFPSPPQTDTVLERCREHMNYLRRYQRTRLKQVHQPIRKLVVPPHSQFRCVSDIPSKCKDPFWRPVDIERSLSLLLKDEHSAGEPCDYVILEILDTLEVTASTSLFFAVESLVRSLYHEPPSQQLLLDQLQRHFMRMFVEEDATNLRQQFALYVQHLSMDVLQDVACTPGSFSPVALQISASDFLLQSNHWEEELQKIRIGKMAVAQLGMDLCQIGANPSKCGIPKETLVFVSKEREKQGLSTDVNFIWANVVVHFETSSVKKAEALSVQVQMDRNAVVFSPVGVDLLAATIEAWYWSSAKIRKIATYQDTEHQLIQKMVHQVCKLASENDYGDPIFLTQPSNFWRLRAKPYQLEDDWKLIAHIRHCAKRLLETGALDDFQKVLASYALSPADALDAATMFDGVIQALTGWRSWEIGDLRESPIMQYVFDFDKRAIQLPEMGLPMKRSFSVHMKSISVRMLSLTHSHSSALHVLNFFSNGTTERLGHSDLVMELSNLVEDTRLQFHVDLIHMLPAVVRLQRALMPSSESPAISGQHNLQFHIATKMAAVNSDVTCTRLVAKLRGSGVVHDYVGDIHSFIDAAKFETSGALKFKDRDTFARSGHTLQMDLITVALEQRDVKLAALTLDSTSINLVDGGNAKDVLAKCDTVALAFPKSLLTLYSAYEETQQEFWSAFKPYVPSSPTSPQSAYSLPMPTTSAYLYNAVISIGEISIHVDVMSTLRAQYGFLNNLLVVSWSDCQSAGYELAFKVKKHLLRFVTIDDSGKVGKTDMIFPDTSFLMSAVPHSPLETRILGTLIISEWTGKFGSNVVEKALTALNVLNDDFLALVDLYMFKKKNAEEKRDADDNSFDMPVKRVAYSSRLILKQLQFSVESPHCQLVLDVRQLQGLVTNCIGLYESFPNNRVEIIPRCWSLTSPQLDLVDYRLSQKASTCVGQLRLQLSAQNYRYIGGERSDVLTVTVYQALAFSHPMAFSLAGHLIQHQRNEIARRQKKRKKDIVRVREQIERIFDTHGISMQEYSRGVIEKAKQMEEEILVGSLKYAFVFGQVGNLNAQMKTLSMMGKLRAVRIGYSTEGEWTLQSGGFVSKFVEEFVLADLSRPSAFSGSCCNELTVPSARAVLHREIQETPMDFELVVGKMDLDIDARISLLFNAIRGAESFVPSQTESSQDAQNTNEDQPSSARFTISVMLQGIDLQIVPLGTLLPKKGHSKSAKTVAKIMAKSGGATEGVTIRIHLPSISAQLKHSPADGYLSSFRIGPTSNTFDPVAIPVFSNFLTDIGSLVTPQNLRSSATAYRKAVAETASIPFSVSVYCPSFKVALTCQPTSKVETCFTIGNVLFTVSNAVTPSRTFTNLVGKVGTFHLLLRHEFASEDCITMTMKDLVLNLSRVRADVHDAISVVTNLSEVTSLHNIRHLHDMIIFYDVWFTESAGAMKTMLGSQISLTTASTDVTDQFKARPSSTYFLFRLAKADLAFDLTQAIGKPSLIVESALIKLSLVEDLSRSFLAVADVIELRSEGRLSGTLAGLVNTKALFSFVDPFKINGGIPGRTLTFGEVDVERFLTQMEFNHERIAVLDINPLQLRISDVWKEFSVNLVRIQVAVDFVMNNVNGIFSKNSVPHVLRLARKLQSLAEERMRAARATSFQAQQVGLPQLKDTSIFRQWPVPVDLDMKLYIIVNNVQIALFKDQFDPNQDCAQIKVESLRMDLDRYVNRRTEIVDRNLTLSLKGKTKVQKCQKKDEKKTGENIQKWSVTQWNDHISRRTLKLILDLPITILVMDSREDPRTCRVTFDFSCDFKGPIDVNLNFGFLKFFQDIAFEFGQQLNASMKDVGGGVARSPTLPAEMGKSTTPLEFMAVNPIRLDPQLKAIEGAPTDILKWLGVSKESVPASVHQAITVSLELVMQQCLAAYVRVVGVPKLEEQ